jgi:hypothetical protein
VGAAALLLRRVFRRRVCEAGVLSSLYALLRLYALYDGANEPLYFWRRCVCFDAESARQMCCQASVLC